ncbi:MAG: hypothetical protein J6R59_09765 [Paludibacteraceae bacterium]|nr:hypothetical protein [Paludibacteraceae bacterium]
MATKKYVSLEKLGLYDEKIKKVITDGDAASLASAKSYADSLATNYDAAGSASTVQGKLDEEVIRAKAKEDELVAANAATQKEVDDLEVYVGTLPQGTAATSVVDYVNVKTAGIATDAALGELNNQVTGLQGVVNGITADYLKGADKTELSDAIKAEENRAKGVESGLDGRVKAIEDDYLKASDAETLQGNIDAVAEDVAEIAGDYLKGADKTELEGKIGAKADQTALDAEIERATGVEEGLQNQINLIMNNPDTKDVIDSITEFTQYIADHGEIADGFRTDIDKNKDDIAAEVKRAGEAESALSGRLDTLEAIDHDAYVDADTALKNELNGEIAKKADSSALTSAVQALEGADSAIKGRLDAVEAQLGDGEGSVADLIADAKQEAIDAAAGDATSKANAAETAAKGHADGLNTAMNARVEALEAIDHDHSNKAELDLIASGDKAKWDAASAKAHEHSNLTVLEGITSAKITEWDKVSGKAEQTALQSEIDRATAAETALGARIDEFVECSEAEINALFTA